MSIEHAATERYEAPLEVYDRLRAATPEERVELLLSLIVSHPEHRLELPTREGRGAMLDGVNLSSESLELRLQAAGQPAHPAWWNAEKQCANLRRADLEGASLRGANLRGVDLTGSRLEGAFLGKVDLRSASLEECNLQRADLAAANLRRAALGEANLSGAMLEEADLRDAALRFADLREAVLESADVRRADLWGARLTKAEMGSANLQRATLREADLAGADLTGANLRGATLQKANLQSARLRGADLRGTELQGANFEGAVLREARLQGLVLSHCTITHIHLSGAKLDDTELARGQLGGAVGEELAGEYEAASQAYLALERNFTDLGDPDSASWAYRRKRRMQKLEARQQARAAWKAGRYSAATAWSAKYASDQFVEWVCDYGESIPRVFVSLLVLYFVFTFTYFVAGSVVREQDGPNGTVHVLTRNPKDLAIFSLLAMTTGSVGIRLLPKDDLALILIGIHVFLGIALIGLLGFVIGNRVRR